MAKTGKLKLFDFTMIVVTLVIGMGIFRTPHNVARESPDSTIFFLAWIAGGLVAYCGALTYAEIGSRLPVTGGYYKVFSYAYHPAVAFAINCVILISNAASLAMVAIVGGEYITAVTIPAGKSPALIEQIQVAIAIAAIVIFYGVNLMGLRMSAKTQNILAIIKISLIVLLITPLFFSDGPASAPDHLVAVNLPWKAYLQAFGTGLIAVSFTYGGYQQTINFGAEVEQPYRTIPRGIFLGIAIIIVLYLTINLAYVRVIGFNQLQNTKNIAAIMAGKVFGAGAEKVLSIFLFLSVLAYVNVLLMSNPRVMYAMSEDGILPAAFKKKDPRRGVLTTSLTVFAGTCILIIFWAREFDRILSFTIFLDCFGMILSAATLFILRRKTRHLDQAGIYRIRFYPLQPILFMAAYVFVAISIALNYQENQYAAAIGTAVMLLFGGLYFVIRKLLNNP